VWSSTLTLNSLGISWRSSSAARGGPSLPRLGWTYLQEPTTSLRLSGLAWLTQCGESPHVEGCLAALSRRSFPSRASRLQLG